MKIGQVILVVCAAVLSGLLSLTLSASESTLILLILPGIFLGYYLFCNPDINFKILLFSSMLIGPLVSYVPGFSQIRWGINLLALLLGLSILLKHILTRDLGSLFKNRVFVLYIFFIAISMAISMIQEVPTKQLIISLKNNFQFFPILLFFLLYTFKEDFPKWLLKSFLLIALIQPPFAMFQYFVIVPKVKVVTDIQGTNLLDAVSGTFGTSLTGGGTGMFTLFTCTVLCGLLAAYGRGQAKWWKWIFISIYILLPMFFNETKAAFLFLLAGSSIMLAIDNHIGWLKKMALGFIAVLFGTAMILGTLQMSAHYRIGTKELVQRTISYSLAEKGYGKYRLNRFSCLTFWLQENKNDPVGLLIGHGLDATVEGDSGLSSPGSVARRYPLYGTGLTTASRMLWETGLTGFSIFGAIFILSFKECVTFTRSTILSSQERFLALCNATGICMTLLLFFYNSLFRNSQPANIFITLLLGLTLWLKTRQAELTTAGG